MPNGGRVAFETLGVGMTATPSTLVRNEIERFLRSSDPEVLCISGAWGVGKTYMWKEVLLATASGEIPPPILKYSYVSLFGVDTLEGLRLSIFSNRISLSKGKLARSIEWGLKAAKTAQSLLEQTPKVGKLFKTLGGMYFSSIRDMVICIDDLERRSKDLEIKDVLGLISYLKEERSVVRAVSWRARADQSWSSNRIAIDGSTAMAFSSSLGVRYPMRE